MDSNHHAEQVRLLLDELSSRFSFVSLSRQGEGGGRWRIAYELEDGRRGSAVQESAGQALRAAAEGELAKHCNGCDQNLPLSAFSQNSSAADGLVSRCKRCEVRRVRQHQRAARQTQVDVQKAG